MLCVMEGARDGTGDATTEFIATGRTGRRNALPDILSSHAATSTADLPEALEKLSCSDSGGDGGAVGGGATGGSSGGAEGGQEQSSGS
ncbi:cAMP-dependent protein kinase inhibitor beta-like [Homarus americanus]|uniref:cAMP-dependent protein kinase inhibitor beta-like n=1 Tax=Homarus americanus TaxID=6706 RepID=A0A8J5JLA2_HOMAM|nr:cAMP-dependent protein kinase inhibitor beta-like [Homarus americanus]